MIALLKGIVELRDDPYIILLTNGVGYKVLAASDVLKGIHLGKEITVYTYTYVREDALELYGFGSYRDLKLFELLISVSGIGPKTAVGIFGLGDSAAIMSAIASNNVDFFTSVPRLGRKNAQKIIIELKSKVGAKGDLDLSAEDSEADDVVIALKSFGFTPKESLDALQAVATPNATPEEKIRLALKYLGK